MTPEARRGHGTRPVPHLSCDEDQVTAGPPLLLPADSATTTQLTAVTPLSSSLLPTLAAGTECSQAPTAMPGACQVHMLLSLSHTFPKGKKNSLLGDPLLCAQLIKQKEQTWPKWPQNHLIV